MINKKNKALLVKLGALFFCLLCWKSQSAETQSSIPAGRLLEIITESEKNDPLDKINQFKRIGFFWNPAVLPRSIRSWMLKELDEDTWHKIRSSDKL